MSSVVGIRMYFLTQRRNLQHFASDRPSRVLRVLVPLPTGCLFSANTVEYKSPVS